MPYSFLAGSTFWMPFPADAPPENSGGPAVLVRRLSSLQSIEFGEALDEAIKASQDRDERASIAAQAKALRLVVVDVRGYPPILVPPSKEGDQPTKRPATVDDLPALLTSSELWELVTSANRAGHPSVLEKKESSQQPPSASGASAKAAPPEAAPALVAASPQSSSPTGQKQEASTDKFYPA